MGTFERLSVVVIGVILVMILVVAVATWSGDPAEPERPPEAAKEEPPRPDVVDPDPEPWVPEPFFPDPEPTPRPEPTPQPEPPAPEPTPGPAPAIAHVHTVQPGETGGQIAETYLGSQKHWPRLRAHNGLESDVIAVGQQLEIPSLEELGIGNRRTPTRVPGSGPKPGEPWKVTKGQDLPTIAKLAYGSADRWPDIWIANREHIETPDDLPEGTLLTLPR